MATEYEAFKACCVGCERKEVESCSIEEPCEYFRKAKEGKSVRYILKIKPDDEIEKVETVRIPTLKQLQSLVGGYIETVDIRVGKYVAIVNEEGKLLQMVPNVAATMMCFVDRLDGDVLILKKNGEELVALDSEDMQDSELCALAEHSCEVVKRWRKMYAESDNDN